MNATDTAYVYVHIYTKQGALASRLRKMCRPEDAPRIAEQQRQHYEKQGFTVQVRITGI